MRKILCFIAITIGVALSLCSCSTASYYTSRTMEKTGHAISHGGEDLEEHTQ